MSTQQGGAGARADGSGKGKKSKAAAAGAKQNAKSVSNESSGKASTIPVPVTLVRNAAGAPSSASASPSSTPPRSAPSPRSIYSEGSRTPSPLRVAASSASPSRLRAPSPHLLVSRESSQSSLRGTVGGRPPASSTSSRPVSPASSTLSSSSIPRARSSGTLRSPASSSSLSPPAPSHAPPSPHLAPPSRPSSSTLPSGSLRPTSPSLIPQPSPSPSRSPRTAASPSRARQPSGSSSLLPERASSASERQLLQEQQSNSNAAPAAGSELPNNGLPQPALSTDAAPQPAPENKTWHRGTGHIAPSSKPPIGGPNGQNAPEPSHAGEEPELIDMDKSELTPKVAPEELARRKVADAKKAEAKQKSEEPDQDRQEAPKPSSQETSEHSRSEAPAKASDDKVQASGTNKDAAKANDAGSQKQEQPASASADSPPKPAEKTAAPPIEFISHSRSVHVHRPAPQHRTTQLRTEEPPLQPLDHSPQVVLIFGWMDAPLRLVSRYAAPYAALYPRATLVLKLSTGQAFMASPAARHAALQGVVKVLQEEAAREQSIAEMHEQYEDNRENQALLTMDTQKVRDMEEQGRPKSSSTPPPRGMIIHSFSDGGASNLSQLLSMLPANVPAPRAVIFDSSPGKTTAWSGATAFTMPMAKRVWLRAIVRSGLYAVLAIVLAFKRLFGRKTWSDLLRAALNSPRRWTPGLETRTLSGSDSGRLVGQSTHSGSAKGATQDANKLPPRLYLYSKTDELIHFSAVEDHAADFSKKASIASPKPQAIKQGTSAAPSEEEQKKGAKGPNVTAPVNLVRWDNAPHCGIAKDDFKGYWFTVRSFLDAHII